MKAERLFTIIGLVDEDLIEEAGRSVKRPWTQTLGTVVAACLALSLAAGPIAALLSPKGMKEEAASAPAASAPTAAEPQSPGTAPESEPFLSYAGPIFPLTTVEETALTATRRLTFDISTPSRAMVYDHYEITNPTEQEITVNFLYPVIGCLGDFDRIEPRMGEWNRMTTPFAGRYAGSFQSAYGSGDPDGTHNLDTPSTWEDYAAAIENGDLEYALSEIEDLTEVVTVYEFSNITGPTDQYDAATLAVEFTIDPESTTVMTYGFNGCTEITGWRQYDFFVPNGERRDTNPKLLVVRGEDLTDYTLHGYADGGCDTLIDGVFCSVTRTEMTIDKLIDTLCRNYLWENQDNFSGILNTDAQALPIKLFRRAAAELLTEYGVLSDAPTDRYADGRLDEIIQEALTLERIFYFRTPSVTLAPGKTYDLTVGLHKEGSFDFAGSGSEKEGVYGYDLLTTLGSSLAFTDQTLCVEYFDYGTSYHKTQGMGFLANITAHNLDETFIQSGETLLDLTQQHFYFEIAP